jgi:uncharacterized protein
MKCAIYKSQRRANTYLFVQQENEFKLVPQALLSLLGRLEFVMTLELTPARALAQADSREVIQQLQEQGYYLQLPPGEFPSIPS